MSSLTIPLACVGDELALRPSRPSAARRFKCDRSFVAPGRPGARSRTSAARRCGSGLSRRRRTPRRRRGRSARRRAWPRRPSVWYSSRKWPPHDSSRSSASRQISSPSSRKSATRPAFSSDWLSSSPVPGTRHVLPELLAQAGDLPERVLEALLVAGHAAVVPHDLAELAVERRRPCACRRSEAGASCGRRPRLSAPRTSGWSAATARELLAGEVVAERVREDEVAVGQALHQRGRAEPVRAVVGEVRLAEHEQAGDRAHQVVVDPEPAHRVVHGGVDPHRDLVRVLVGDPLVHLEEVAVLLLDRASRPGARSRRGSRGRRPGRSARRRGPRRRPPWRRARRCRAARGCRSSGTCARGSSRARPRGSGPARRLSPFFFGTQIRPSLRSDSRHQRQLALVVAGDRDAGRVDLRVAGVGERRALLVGAPDRRGVAALGVGREVEDVAVAAGRQEHRVGRRATRARPSPGRARRCRGRGRRRRRAPASRGAGTSSTVPRPICRSSAWYAPSRSCWPVWPRA